METQFCSKWRPNGYPNLSEMGTFAGTNGDPKSDFMKIYLNELNTWNTEEKNYGKTPSQSMALFGAQVCAIKTSFVITSIQMVNI